MKIKEIKKKNRSIKDFEKKEWAVVDREHYGKPVKWEKKNYILVAHDDAGKIIGTLNSSIRAGVACVSTILVAKDRRGGKIGTKIMLKTEKFAKKRGAHKIWLKTGKDWGSAKFYKSLGYKITGKFLNHSFHKDFVIFTKFLK
jgi:GNAT superfamily N-acetyltransferase